MKECLKCKIDYEDSSIFCQRCGRKLTEKQIMEEEISFCPNCGKKLNGDFEFCPECGDKINLDKASDFDNKEKGGRQRKWVLSGIVMIVLFCIVGIGFLVRPTLGKKDKTEEDKPEYQLNEIVYLKDDEYYIVDKDGKSVQLTQNYYGEVKEKAKTYYESGEWEYDYEFDFDDEGYTRENLSWEQFWGKLRDWWDSCRVSVVNCGNKDMLLYSDQLKGEITLYYDEDIEEEYYTYESLGYDLYCLSMDNLEEEPILIDTDVSSYKEIGESYISYKKYGSEEENIYNLSTMKKDSYEENIDSAIYEEDELYVTCETVYGSEYDGYADEMDKLYIHQEDGEKLLEKDIVSFDDTAKDKGIYYYINSDGEFYKYSIKKGESLIDENVEWISEGFNSGEIYYAVAEEQKVKMGDFIKNDTSNPDLWLLDEEYTYNIYHYFYFDGKNSTELGESLTADTPWSRDKYNSMNIPEEDYLLKKEQAATADAYCVLTMKDPGDMPRVLQSEIVESARWNWELEMEEEEEDSYSNYYSDEEWDGVVTVEDARSEINYAFDSFDESYYALALQDADLVILEDEYISEIYFNEAGTDFGYMCEKGLMHGSIEGKNVTISPENDEIEYGSVSSWGLIGNDLWYFIDSNEYNEDGIAYSRDFYVNEEKMDEGELILSKIKYDGLYYYNSESKKYIMYKDDKLNILAEEIDEWVGKRTEEGTNENESDVLYKKGNVLYWYNLEKNQETEIGTDIANCYLTNTDLCFYTKENGGDTVNFDLYLVNAAGEDLLLESQIDNVQPISTY
ncbi:MAG: zinc ribbon domain-containing protein [Lachnospiraceae bacterium]